MCGRLVVMCATAPLATIKDGQVFANSRDVAEYFGKEHRNVLRDITNLVAEAPACALNFEQTSVQVPMPRGGVRLERAFDMTRDGFTLLAMGLTGKVAARLSDRVYSYGRNRSPLRACPLGLT